MKVNVISCSNCNDVLLSRSLHDFHRCSCKAMFIDGGTSYLRCGWNSGGETENPVSERPIPFTIEIEQTKEELYNDWNNGKNKYGTIKKEDFEKKYGNLEEYITIHKIIFDRVE